jgi:hypothetical protein
VDDDVRQRLKGTGVLQKRLLVWLGQVQGIKSPDDLRDRWPMVKMKRRNSSIAAITDAVNFLQEPVPEHTPYAPYLRDSYFSGEQEQEPVLPDGLDWIAWESKEFLGCPPSQNQSVSISKAIKSLEDRGLIQTAKVLGKQKRVSHIALTFEGEVASVLLQVNAVSTKGRGLRPAGA